MDYTLTAANAAEARTIFAELILPRIAWMAERNMQLWDRSGYLESFPLPYFEACAARGELLAMRRAGEERIIGAVALLEYDKLWAGDPHRACYIHNLVAAMDTRGVGADILRRCEDIARDRGFDRLRLDCNIRSPFLNRYYLDRGYAIVGEVVRGEYHGIKREKLLK